MGILDAWLGQKIGQSIKEQIQEDRIKQCQAILVDADESLTYLKQIRDQKDEALRQKALLEQLSVQTESCWAGQSGDALRTLLAQAIKEQSAIAADLEENATLMMQAIQSLVDTDERIAEMIRNDTPGGHSGFGSSSGGSGRRG